MSDSQHPDQESSSSDPRSKLRDSGLIVVKIGSSVLRGSSEGGIDESTLESICDGIALFCNDGKQVIVVSSGAIALGVQEVGMESPPVDIDTRQALAAIGQSRLMRVWNEKLASRGLTAAQVLLTHEDLANRKRYLNARRAVQALLALQAVPVVNENDTVAVEEIQLGDNDFLSGQVAVLSGADLLIILSTYDGLYNKNPDTNPDAERVPLVEIVDSAVEDYVDRGKSEWGTGGMATKLQAARAAARFGACTVIASGKEPGVLQQIISGKDTGTLILPEPGRIRSRKHWIGFTLKPSAKVVIDTGAVQALCHRGTSLLPSGIIHVKGEFDVGDCVRVCDGDGHEIARGLANYSAAEVNLIAGHRSEDIESILGYRNTDVVIHRDDLVLI